ncbi:MAG: S8 family peptidase [Candidatus Uhrbacteria bacterium]
MTNQRPRRIVATVLLGLFVCAPVFARVPNDPLYSKQWYLDKIGAPAAWDIGIGTQQTVVAVLDSGVDPDHPDLTGNIWTNPGEIAGNGIDDDGNGYVDDVHGWDFVDGDDTPEPDVSDASTVDGVAHGTIVAGVIGAVGNNGEGVAGVSWQTRIMPLRILDDYGSGDSGKAREAIAYAVKNGANVINLSFTGFDADKALQSDIHNAFDAGVSVVAAVGNDNHGGLNLDDTPVYPVCFGEGGDDWVIGVAATTEEDTKADFSNYGSNCTDISAPGVDVFGTMYQNDAWIDFPSYYEGGWDGTSVASPIVAGAVALLKSAYPSLTPSLIRTILQLSVDPLREKGTDAVGKLGPGRLNIGRAMQIAPSFAAAASDHPQPLLDEGGGTSGKTSRPTATPSHDIVTATATPGLPPTVRVFTRDGALVTQFDAYAPTFLGGVRVAVGDVDGDGKDDIVTVPAPGGGPQVRVFGMDGKFKSQFFAFETASRTGLNVATGDVNGDGTEEIVVSEDAKGQGRIRTFMMDGAQVSEMNPFLISSPLLRQGGVGGGPGLVPSIRVATGDVDGDGNNEIIASRGAGFGPEVRVLSATGATIGTVLAKFDAYAPTYVSGVYVSAGDLNGDGIDEIVTGTDAGGGPQVRVFTETGRVVGSFFAYDSLFRGGVRVSVANLDGGVAQIVTAPGPGGGPQIRAFDLTGKVLGGFFAGDQADRRGLSVAGWSL